MDFSGERRLPAGSLPATLCSADMKFASNVARYISASCRDGQAGSLRSPELRGSRFDMARKLSKEFCPTRQPSRFLQTETKWRANFQRSPKESVAVCAARDDTHFLDVCQCVGHGVRQGTWTCTAEGYVDCFEPSNQIEHFAARVRSAGRGAKMGPATEGT